jgi:Domain of unknown function (DUF2760)
MGAGKEKGVEMNRMGLVILLVLMFLMSCLTAAAFLGAKFYIDPALKELAEAASADTAIDAHEIIPYVERLRRLRARADFYVPASCALAGLIATLMLSLIFRRALKRLALAAKGPGGPVSGIGPEPEPDVVSGTAPEKYMDVGAFRMLALLQGRGRLVDFLQEDIAGYPDAQIGAAVRYIHQDCRKALDEYVALAPVLPEEEGGPVVVPAGFNPAEVRLVGRISGQPPFEGVLHHSGWRVTRISLPDQPEGQDPSIIAPAEVEIGEPSGETT